ncbi:DUF3025 domain-containing protein [Acidovorax soli]|uniref:DUF3025 domain-containing protein n=1 Tax=Acidovorax soli TaxID=592050 RepID=UPI0032B167B6
MAAGVAAVDWGAAWLAPWRATGEPVAQRIVRGDTVHSALQAALGAGRGAMRFVPQSELPDGTAYEQFIFDTRHVPTRDNLHDFFNGLVWLQFPLTKRRLNQLQARAIAADGVHAVRGALRDALTVFDENGAVLDAPAPLWQALNARDWRRLFVELRPLWCEARLVLFGHALLEKLVYPRKPITAHVYQAQAAMDSAASLDAWLAQQLQPEHLVAKPFVPLPVLGIPGWWPGNENFSFYDDSLVFRSAPRKNNHTMGSAAL